MSYSPDSKTHPAVGIAVLLWDQRRILIGQRNKSPMAGSWQLPGGWLHCGESPEQAVNRLLGEFHGLQYDGAEFVAYTNNIFDMSMHSVSLYFSVQCLTVEDDALQHNKRCKTWKWADWNNLPQPLFLPLHLLHLSGQLR